MSLGRLSRFCSPSLAKGRSEKVLSSFVSASSITSHHGGMSCCQDPCHGCWQNLDEYGNAQVLESTRKHQVLSLALTGICFQFPRLCYNLFKQWTHSLLLGFSPVTRIIPSICIFVPSLHRQCVILPWVSSISGDKQIHPLRCLQQGNPHHPFWSGYVIPPNSSK